MKQITFLFIALIGVILIAGEPNEGVSLSVILLSKLAGLFLFALGVICAGGLRKDIKDKIKSYFED